jgi:hypothetical protein
VSDDHPIVWETDLPLFGREMVHQWTGAMLATAALMLLLLGTIFVAQGEWDSLRALGGIVLAVTAGIWLFGFVVMALVFRGRYHVRYTLAGDGIRCETVEPVARKVNRLAMLLGLLSRKPGLVGAGMIAQARESEAVRWSGGFTASPRPDGHAVALRNRWRTLMLVQCTPENYAAVSERIDREMAAHGTAGRVATGSPLPFYLGHTALITLASVGLFLVAEAYDLDVFVPILVLCFALATLWLVNLFGYVVIVGVGYMVLAVAFRLLEVQQSVLFPGHSYRGYEVLGGDESTALVLGALASAYLVWLSVRAVRGRFLALLLRDYGDMAGG